MEYPGYGEYDGKPNENKICKDAIRVFDYLTSVLKISPDSISVLGRSMGSGPSIHLCANRHPANLILVSPYTSIKNVSKELIGKFMSSLLIKERFSNILKIEEVCCPILLIHGKKDKLVPHSHSQLLAEKAIHSRKVKVCLNENMEHNHFNMYIKIVNPIFEFFKELNYVQDSERIIKKEALLNYGMILRFFNKYNGERNGEKSGTGRCAGGSGGYKILQGDCDGDDAGFEVNGDNKENINVSE